MCIVSTMKLYFVHSLQFTAILLWGVFLSSCSQYEVPRDVVGPVYIEVSPHEIIASGGSSQTIWVKVLDAGRNPVPEVQVHARSDTPARVTVSPERLLTNGEGVAVFTASGISRFPGAAHIIFDAEGLSASVKTDFLVW